MIPPVFHQIWVGPDPLPAEFAAYAQTWRDLHPGWEYRLWTDDNLPAMANRHLFDDAAELTPPLFVHQFKADVLRYEILWNFGGVYIDTDFECLANIEHLLVGVEAFAAWELQGTWVNNAIMGAEPGHPFLARAIAGLPAAAEHHKGQRPNESVGPQYLTPLYRMHPEDLTVFGQHLFYPYLHSDIGTPKEHLGRERAVAVHHWNNRRRRLAQRGRR